jgi:ketosteroid isomerase-like protein
MQPSHHHAQPSAPTDRTDDESAALATFERYSAAFRALDPGAVAAFYQQPALLLSPRGDFTLTSAVEIEHVYGRVMSEARECGYTRTSFDELRALRIGAGEVAVMGSGHWVGANGENLMSFELSYVLRRGDGVWKIAMASIRAT